MEPARDDDLDLAAESKHVPMTIRRACPVCLQIRVTDVCATCGVDVATGELVQAPAPPAGVLPEPPPSRERHVPLVWDRGDVLRGLKQGLFGGHLAAWLIFSLQVIPAALFGMARQESTGGMELASRVVTLYLLAFVLVARTRAVVRMAPPYELEDVGASLLRAILVSVALWPALSGPGPAFAVAGLLPLFLGALSSERPLADLSPVSLWLALRRSDGFLRATLWSLVVLGPALCALPVESPWALWRPPVLVLAATVAGVTAGHVRHSAEVRAPEA